MFFPYSRKASVPDIYPILLYKWSKYNLHVYQQYLGNIPCSQMKNNDIRMKRGLTIDNMNGVLEDFNFVHPGN